MGQVRPRQNHYNHDYSTNLFSQHQHLFYTICTTILSERCHLTAKGITDPRVLRGQPRRIIFLFLYCRYPLNFLGPPSSQMGVITR